MTIRKSDQLFVCQNKAFHNFWSLSNKPMIHRRLMSDIYGTSQKQVFDILLYIPLSVRVTPGTYILIYDNDFAKVYIVF